MEFCFRLLLVICNGGHKIERKKRKMVEKEHEKGNNFQTQLAF